ncbi:hypothetical protein LOD99_12590 [Oopsacas minuta]|uniref:Uncharacterized protein n=1 Tax=Oopsacas minuta TaxID=111878 RepID=A0AAV7JCH0_9METZ|nr:hypothetical protein LOD99_12590 [Oopsacas minuta]
MGTLIALFIFVVLSTSIRGPLAFDLLPSSIVNENTSLSFEGASISIILAFNESVNGLCFLGQDFTLSNDANFSSNCTFPSLSFIFEPVTSFVHTFILTPSNSTEIKLFISNNPSIECLTSSESTFLQISPILSVPIQLNVIPDTTPPLLTRVEIDLLLGTLMFIFNEPIILDSFNNSGSSIESADQSIQISNLTNGVFTIETGLASETYTILLTVTEVSVFNDICPCVLMLSGGSFSDVFGNYLSLTSDFLSIAVLKQFSLSDWGVNTLSVFVSPFGYEQANVFFSAPFNLRPSDSVYYQVFIYAKKVDYYHGSCEYPPGYAVQLNTMYFRLNINESLPCENSSDYLCYVTSDLSLLVDIFVGVDQFICIQTIYTDITILMDSCNSLLISEFYADFLRLTVFSNGFVEENYDNFILDNSSFPFAIGNRVLLSWITPDISFCEQHRMTIHYTESILGKFLHNIEIDSDTLCGGDFVYLYIPTPEFNELVYVYTDIRFISPSNLIPDNTCGYTRITLEAFGGFIQNIDIPVIRSISSFDENIAIDWSTIVVTPDDYFNVYIFPVYALRYNGSSCNNLDSETHAEEFSLFPTEYYNYGVNAPQQFDLSCPLISGASLPYQCYSLFSNHTQLIVPIDSTYAVGIIVEAVLLNAATGILTKVQSYPAIYSALDISFGRIEGLSYQEASWSSNLCLPISFTFFRVFENTLVLRSSVENFPFASLFFGNKIISCESTPTLLTVVPPAFDTYGYIFTDTVTTDGSTCLSGFESNQISRFGAFPSSTVLEFTYLNYNTISLSIAINGVFDQPATIYFLPYRVNQFQLNNITQCPNITNDTELINLTPSPIQFFSLVDMPLLPCENTSNYTCITVERTLNLVVNVLPGFDHAIRVNSSNSVRIFESALDGIPNLNDPDLINEQSLLYTSVQLISNTSVLVEWDTDFYCPPDSYIYLYWDQCNPSIEFPFITTPPPQLRRRRDTPLSPSYKIVILECVVGSYVINNLNYSNTYCIDAEIFFNSNTFISSCPTFQISFNEVTTPDFIQEVKILDFANVQVKWNIVPGVSSYTLMGIPTGVTAFTDQINSVYSTSLLPFPLDFTQSLEFPIETLYQYCLNGSAELTCSILTTTLDNAVLNIIPGYEYKFVVVYELQGATFYHTSDSVYPDDFILDLISISGFARTFFFQYDSQICTNGSRTVFHYSDDNVISKIFRVQSCFNSSALLEMPNNTDPVVLFIFPYQPIQFPGSNFVLNFFDPTHIAISTRGVFSFLPEAAAPFITDFLLPTNLSSNVYQVEWTSSPLIPIAQQFESYTLYALPSSTTFSMTEECPVFIFPGCFLGRPISPLITSGLQIDICPSDTSNFYFCEESSSSLEGSIELFPLLDYNFFVEAIYSGGLRAYRPEAGSRLSAIYTLLESLNLTYNVTSSSIQIYWDITSSFCVDSTISFTYSTQFDASIVVACQLGFYSIEPLQSLTEYEVYLYFNYDPTRLHPGPERCVRSNPQLAFNPLPITSSICSSQQPCGSLGMCSEGFSNNSFFCDCLSGYEFNGITCADINECSADPNPCTNSACVNTEGSYSCICFNGYTRINGQCVDIDECNLPDNCVNGICINLLPPENYVCDCDPFFGGRTCNISTISNSVCASFTESNEFGIDLTFPATPLDSDSIIPCTQLDSTLFGTISKRCNIAGIREETNYQNCLSASFLSLQNNGQGPFTPEESIIQSIQLASATSGVLYPGEIMQTVSSLEAIRDSLMNLTGNELINTLAQVQDNIVLIASNVFRSENRIAFLESPQTQTETEISSIVTTVEELGQLLGSVIPVNSSVLIEERNVALVVAVVSDPVDAVFIGPASIGDQSALSRGQASVSIPANVVRANDAGDGVEVSFSVFPSLSLLLGEVDAVVSRTARETSINDSIATAISNLNIFTRGIGMVEQLNEDILLSFGLLFDPPLLDNSIKFAISYSCVSTQSIEQGWITSGTTLSNSPQVLPGPAQCSVSHLTNFAVLVSAISLNLTPQENLAIEILSYLLGSLSIIFLLISVVSYIILWIRTRKLANSLFKKDATILHFNFAVALLLALLFFIFSAGAYSNRPICLALTIIQYYFWLSVFTASFSIGLYLFIKIFAWGVERRFWHYLVILSWSLPIPLLIITPSITHEYIIDDIDEVCWLSNEPRFVSLAFIIPMVIVTLANFVALVLTAIVLFKVSKGKGNLFVQLRSVLLATFILAPLLGLPWLFSVFASVPTPATAFIFTIVLGLQGVIFTILYPFRTPEIVMYVFLWKPVHQASSFPIASNTNPGSNPTSNKPPAALKFRINRKGHTESPSANQSSEANNFLAIQLEPVTIESSLRQAQSQNKKEKHNSQVITNPGYSTSISVPSPEIGGASMKIPYESLPID